MIKESGFYIIKDEFFEVVNDKYLKDNKDGNRPHYYCFQDNVKGIYWMIPLSSKIDKYKKIVSRSIEKRGRCDIIMIAKLDDDRTSAFLIQDMFPVTIEYIDREYTISGNHLIVTSEHIVKEIDVKASRVLKLIKNGVRFNPTQPNSLKIYKDLKSNLLKRD